MLRYHKKSSTFFNQVNWKKDILPQNSQKSTFWTLSMLRRLSKRVTLNVNTKHRGARSTQWQGTEAGEGAIVRLDHPQRDETGLRGWKGQEGRERVSQGMGEGGESSSTPWFTVGDIFSSALVGAYRTTALDNGGRLTFCFELLPAWPVLSISASTARHRCGLLFSQTALCRAANYARTVRSIRFEFGGCPFTADLPSPATGQKDSAIPAICWTCVYSRGWEIR